VHAAFLHRAKLPRERIMHGTRPRHAAHAAKCLTDHQDAVVGLPNVPLANVPLASRASSPHMTGMMRAVIGHAQHRGRERGGQGGSQTIGAISFHAHS
jgi:hypothetical protein